MIVFAPNRNLFMLVKDLSKLSVVDVQGDRLFIVVNLAGIIAKDRR